MKIDCYSGGSIETLELRELRPGRFEMKVTFFPNGTCTRSAARGIMEKAQLKQLAKTALELAGEPKLAEQIPKFAPFWSNNGGSEVDDE